MTEFSSVSMRILSPDGKTVLAELQTIDRANVRTARNMGSAQTQALAGIQTKSAIAARQIAGNIAMIAQAGETTAATLKGIVSQGANVAFMFGTGGAIAGAIGMTALAIFNLFTRTREEIEKTARKAAEELRSLAQSGNLGGVGGRFGVATQLFSGDRFAVRAEGEDEQAFKARKMGIQGIRVEIERLVAVVNANKPIAGQIFGGTRAITHREAADSLKAWRSELDKMVPRYQALIGLYKELSAEVDFAAQKSLEQKRASGDAARGRVLDDLMDPRKTPGVGITGQPISFNPIDFGETVQSGIIEALKRTPPLPPINITPEIERILQLDQAAESIAMTFGQTFAAAISEGVQAGLAGGVGDGFATLTGGILSAIGSMMQQIGTAALLSMKFLATIKEALMTFMPEIGIPAAIGLIALGGILKGAGASMGGGSSGGGSSGYSGYGSSGGTTTYVGVLNPTPAPNTAGLVAAQPINVYGTFIGTRDATVQRDLLKLLKYARERGEI